MGNQSPGKTFTVWETFIILVFSKIGQYAGYPPKTKNGWLLLE
jgi:hypothetical protein